MRPFPGSQLPECQAIFNYRLSRARRVIENAFGIMVAKWRIFKRATIAHPDRMEKYIKAAVVLHNFLKKAENNVPPEDRSYCPNGFIDSRGQENGQWRDIIANDGGSMILNIPRMGSNNYTHTASEIRNLFANYFSSDAGSVPWQHDMVNRGR